MLNSITEMGGKESTYEILLPQYRRLDRDSGQISHSMTAMPTSVPAALALLQQRVPARFFACCAAGTIDSITQQFPDTVRQILIDAERLHAGDFDLLGYRGLRFGNPIDCRDFVGGCVSRAPMLHEFTIPACPRCLGTQPRCDFLPFHDGEPDVWTLTESA